MTLRQLEYFAKVAETLNYTKAAENLYISQPALSYMIRELEKELSVSLFYRDTAHNRIYLTEAGELFLKHTSKALKHISEARETMQQYVMEKDRIIRIGYIHTFAVENMIKLSNRFLEKEEASSITLQREISISNSELLNQVKTQQFHFAFTLSLANGIDGLPFSKQELYVIVSKNHPLGQKKTISFEELKREPRIRVEAAIETNQIVDDIYRQNNAKPIILASNAGNLYASLDYVLNYNCYIIAPLLTTMDFSQLTALRIDRYPMYRTIYFCWKSGKKFSPEEKLFLNFVESQSYTF